MELQYKLPIILFIFIVGYYSLIMAMFLAAAKDPATNLHRLNIYVVDFDGGFVGQALLNWVHAIKEETQGNFLGLEIPVTFCNSFLLCFCV